MGSPFRHIPGFIAVLVACWVQGQFRAWMLDWEVVRSSPALARKVRLAWDMVIVWLVLAWAMGEALLLGWLEFSAWEEWTRGASVLWALVTAIGWAIAAPQRWLARRSLRFHPSRRRLLVAGQSLALAAPLAAVGYGVFIGRREFRLQEVDVRVPGLPRDLEGLRLVQLSDIHMSPFLSSRDLDYAVSLANETRPHLALVTGDLITARRDPLQECLRILSRLRADAGVYGCLGNHEIVAGCEAEAARDGLRLGLHFLRQESRILRFGDARLNLVGFDYQRFSHPYLPAGERFVRPDMVNVLLSHNPDVFPVAARQGYQLTLAGHTHGGQVTVEILHQYVNVARFFTPFVYGLYCQGDASIYVTRGLGTVGAPARIGAPPEVALIRLCST